MVCKLLIFNGAKIIGICHLNFFDRLSGYLQIAGSLEIIWKAQPPSSYYRSKSTSIHKSFQLKRKKSLSPGHMAPSGLKDDWLNRVKENIGKQNVKSNIPHFDRTF
jgi:hypothetical protein